MKFASFLLLITVLTLRASPVVVMSPSWWGTGSRVVSRTEQMQILRAEVDAAETVYIEAVTRDENSTNTEQVWNYYRRLNQTNFPKVFKLAAAAPAAESSGDAFVWVVTNRFALMKQFATNSSQALDYLRDYHANNTNLARLCRIVGRRWDPLCEPAMNLLYSIVQKNPDREVRGQATLALARLIKKEADGVAYFSEAPAGDAEFERTRTNYLAEIGDKHVGELAREAEDLLNTILRNYADCPTPQVSNSGQVKRSLGDEAAVALYALTHLSLGAVAPEVVGEDQEGHRLRLADYRGKVVVLSFWASWCGPCMAMVPAEVKLAERMKGKPFALIGVNGDDQSVKVQEVTAKNGMTWPSFCNTNGPEGPIPTAWNVSSWPTVFVLDPRGVVRFKLEGDGGSTEQMLNAKIDELLKEAGEHVRG